VSRFLPSRAVIVVLALFAVVLLAPAAASAQVALPSPALPDEGDLLEEGGDEGDEPADDTNPDEGGGTVGDDEFDEPGAEDEEGGDADQPAADKACRYAKDRPTRKRLARVRAAVLCLLNKERAKAGLPRLRVNAKLRRAAERHSRDMVRKRFFGHTSPAGASVADRVLRTGYASRRSWAVAENIAWGAGSKATPAEIVRAWMASSGHKANILDRRYKDIGVGVFVGTPVSLPGGSRGATYTLNFGRRG